MRRPEKLFDKQWPWVRKLEVGCLLADLWNRFVPPDQSGSEGTVMLTIILSVRVRYPYTGTHILPL